MTVIGNLVSFVGKLLGKLYCSVCSSAKVHAMLLTGLLHIVVWNEGGSNGVLLSTWPIWSSSCIHLSCSEVCYASEGMGFVADTRHQQRVLAITLQKGAVAFGFPAWSELIKDAPGQS